MDNNKNKIKGNLPPQAIDLEKVVLGAILIDSKALVEVDSFLSVGAFYLPNHQNIYKAAKSLYTKNMPIDLMTVANELKSLGLAFDMVDLVKLSQCVSSAANITSHAVILLEKFVKRRVIEVATNAIKHAYDDTVSPDALLDVLGQGISQIDDSISSEGGSLTWYDAITQMPKHIENLTNNKGLVTGLPTGLKKLDNHFSGWQRQEFIVIGGDSGMGKTAFVMCSMLAVAKSDNPVGMFSMEMSVKKLAIRGVAVESDFHMNQLMRTGFEKNKYFETLLGVVDEMKDYPIHIDDKPALTVYDMKRKARALKRVHNIEILVIDFIQMFSGDKEMRINIGEAARECKNLAKELDIPVIALSQISREVRKSRYHLPKKYHLKEASAIEEAADVIGMLYRPGYYGYDSINSPDLFDELQLIGEENAALLVEKNRNGSLGPVGLRYIEDKTKYVDGVIDESIPY